MVSRQKFCHLGSTGLETCAAHRLSSLCSFAVALPSLVADADRFKSSAAWLQAFHRADKFTSGRTAADTGCESKVWSRYMNISAKRITLTLPEIGLIAMTRGALGVGIGLKQRFRERGAPQCRTGPPRRGRAHDSSNLDAIA